MDSYMHMTFLHSSPVGLVITRCIELFFDFEESLEPLPCSSCHMNTPTDNHIYSPFIQCFLVDLVVTRYPEIISIFPKILWAYRLAVLYHMHTPIENSSHLSSIRSSPVVRMLHKILWNIIRPSEHPLRTIALQILVCLHYGCSHITSNIH